MGVSAAKIKTQRDPKQKSIPIQQKSRRQQQLTSMSSKINQRGLIEGMASDATFFPRSLTRSLSELMSPEALAMFSFGRLLSHT